MRKLSFAGLCAVGVLLSACAVPQPYVAPQSGNTAKLIVKPGALGVGVSSIDVFDDAHVCNGPKVLMTTPAQPSGDMSALVRADQELALRLRSSVSNWQCTVIISFLPKTNHKYYLSAGFNGTVCALQVRDVTSGEAMPEVSIRKRAATSPLSGGWCSATEIKLEKANSGQTTLDDLRALLPSDDNAGVR